LVPLNISKSEPKSITHRKRHTQLNHGDLERLQEIDFKIVILTSIGTCTGSVGWNRRPSKGQETGVRVCIILVQHSRGVDGLEAGDIAFVLIVRTQAKHPKGIESGGSDQNVADIVNRRSADSERRFRGSQAGRRGISISVTGSSAKHSRKNRGACCREQR
jgi:hypothetical protein